MYLAPRVAIVQSLAVSRVPIVSGLMLVSHYFHEYILCRDAFSWFGYQIYSLW